MRVKNQIFTLFLFIVFILFCSSSFVEAKTLLYKTYDPSSGGIINRFSCVDNTSSPGVDKIYWKIQEGGDVTEEEYILDDNFETTWWKVVNEKDDTNYVGEKSGDSLLLSGKFKGKTIRKTLKLEGKPFYYNPKLGLKGFVLSDEKTRRFTGFHNQALKVFPMKASKEAVESITVNGKNESAVRVFWAVDDLRSVFFNRTYWFRESDGTYLRQEVEGGKFRELTSEEPAAGPGVPPGGKN